MVVDIFLSFEAKSSEVSKEELLNKEEYYIVPTSGRF